MAIDQGTENLTLVKSERSWRVEIFCEHGADPLVRVHRETVGVAGGQIVSRERAGVVVERQLSAVATEQINGMSCAQLAAQISAVADAWRQQDIAAAAAEASEQ